MFSYFDEEFTYAGDTVLLYTGFSGRASVPSDVAGNPVRRIGNGAFESRKSLKFLEIAEGIEEIGSYALFGCSMLRTLLLPSTLKRIGNINKVPEQFERADIRLRLEKSEYELLCGTGQRTADGKLVLRRSCVPKEAAEKAALIGIELSRLSEDRDLLFSESYQLEDTATPGEVPVIWNMTPDPGIRSERDAAAFCIRNGRNPGMNAAQETEMDWLLRTRGARAFSSLVQKEAIVWFSDKNAIESDETVLVTLHFTRNYFFGIRTTPVTVSGETYYIYAREYMVKQQVFREDLAIINADGSVVSDNTVRRNVYGKYKLPVIL